jgi:hypothetical protein
MRFSYRGCALAFFVVAGRALVSQTVERTPASTRALGMGNVGIASSDDDVLFYNPAQLVVARGTSASGERYSGTSGGGALSSVTRFNGGGIAVGATLLDYQSDDGFHDRKRGQTLTDGPDMGLSAVASVALAQRFKGVRWGIAAKYASEQFGATRSGAAQLDAGLSRDFRRYFTVGLSARNIPLQSQAAFVFQPFNVTLGGAASRSLGPLDCLVTAATFMDSDGDFHGGGGGEVSWSWLAGYSIAGRAGVRSASSGERLPTAGAGFTMDRLTVDYALELLSGSRVGHRFGFRIR